MLSQSGTHVADYAQMGNHPSDTQVDASLSPVRPKIKLKKIEHGQSKSASMSLDVGEGPSRSMEKECLYPVNNRSLNASNLSMLRQKCQQV